MVVNDNQPRSIRQKGRSKYFARVHKTTVENTSAQLVDAKNLASHIEQQEETDFNGLQFEASTQQGDGIARSAHLRGWTDLS